MARLNWGMIGGGQGSQIGPAHRIGALADGRFNLVAAAPDHRPEEGRAFARHLGVATERAYGDWQEMLAAERDRPDRLDQVTVATPNATHFPITRAFLAAGFHVLCEKPMTMTVAEAEVLTERERIVPGRPGRPGLDELGLPVDEENAERQLEWNRK